MFYAAFVPLRIVLKVIVAAAAIYVAQTFMSQSSPEIAP